MTVARKPGHRGERAISRNPPRREGRIASAEPVCSCAFLFVHFAHETAGAARTRSSLRPLISEGGNLIANLARNRRRDRGIVPANDACLKNESVTMSGEITSHQVSSLRKQGPITTMRVVTSHLVPALNCTAAAYGSL